jgi:hypothetical protein
MSRFLSEWIFRLESYARTLEIRIEGLEKDDKEFLLQEIKFIEEKKDAETSLYVDARREVWKSLKAFRTAKMVLNDTIQRLKSVEEDGEAIKFICEGLLITEELSTVNKEVENRAPYISYEISKIAKELQRVITEIQGSLGIKIEVGVKK